MKDYAKNEMERWAYSAIEAYLMEENERYRVNGDKIEPIDNDNTGIILHSTHLSYGLQQFLQLKHNCTLTSVSTITSYLSNVGFFRLYLNENSNNIIGLTGTLGSQTAQDLLNKIYELDFVFIPPSSERMLIQLLPRLEKNDKDWMNSIIKTCLREAKFGREILIICKSIKIVNKIYNEIIKVYNSEKVHTLKDDIDTENNFDNLPPGTIIIATNLAGRGTDIPIAGEILKKGGLHVCLTFLPINIRVQEQAFGRAGRKGQPGTWQLVLNLFNSIEEISHVKFREEQIKQIFLQIKLLTSLESNIVRLAFNEKEEDKQLKMTKGKMNEKTEIIINCKDLCYELYNSIQDFKENRNSTLLPKIPLYIEDLDFIREEKEKNMLKQAESEIEKIIKKDNLFIKYTNFLKEKLSDLEPRSMKFNDIEEQWGFFLNKINYENKNEEEMNSEFSEFTKDILERKSKSNYLKNSGFICQIVNRKLYKYIPDKDNASILENIGNFIISLFGGDDEKKEIEQQIGYAMKYCKDDCNLNGDFSFITFYYYSICNIFFGNIEKAKENLNKSKNLIEEDIKFLASFSVIIPNYLSNLKKAINKKFIFYNNIKDAIIKPSLDLLNNSKRTR